MDDASIIELLRKRDESALEEVKTKYHRLCLYIAENILAQSEDAEECVNSAYMGIWENIPPDSPENLKIYLCRIVRNIAIDRLKYNTAGKRNPQFSVSLDELSECIPDRYDNISARELARTISVFLRTLDESHRKIFVRRYWYGDSVYAISQRFGIKEKTVATYLFRTRKKLKVFLKKEGYDYG